jgi:hypothetical protein
VFDYVLIGKTTKAAAPAIPRAPGSDDDESD